MNGISKENQMSIISVMVFICLTKYNDFRNDSFSILLLNIYKLTSYFIFLFK